MNVDTLSRSQLLQARLRGLSFMSPHTPRTSVPTDIETLNDLLPEVGIVSGSFVEILSADDGAGAYSLALTMARSALPRREAWAVVDSGGTFHPPAAAAMGYDLKQLILLRPRADDDAWTFTQLLRSSDISVCFWMTRRMDSMVFRRLQLAAERGEGLGFVMRPHPAEHKPCWASLRLKASWRSMQGSAEERRSVGVRVLRATGHLINSSQEIEVTL